MIRAALHLAARGLPVFPCWPMDKLPATTHGCLDATIDASQIREWWRREPHYNIAVATGPASGIFVVDVDGPDAEAELKKLETQYRALPSSVEVITPRPGRHIYFKWPDRSVRNSTGKIAPGVDTRGDGGYILVPPSVHPSGRKYVWSVDSASAFADAPDWLLDKVATPKNCDATPPLEWRELVCNGAEEGLRNDSIARLAGMLLRRRLDPLVALEFLTSWNATHCRPPLDDAEVASIVDSIAARELKRRGLA
jgi:hypothetical protein